jgi:hypothetical protein
VSKLLVRCIASPNGGQESRGVVDLIAVRKDHSEPRPGTKRVDALQIILIQVKGGSTAKPIRANLVPDP